jgi:phosphoesterase RecJ-like protein
MNSTYPSTLRMASSLLEVGVDRDMIIQNVYNSFKEGRIRLQGHVLKDLLNITQDGVAYIVLDKEAIRKYNIQDGDTEGFVNIPLSIKGVFMSIFIKEDEDRVRVSIRSRKGTSANRCAKKFFNGGGHENAAGGRLYIPQDIASINDAAAYIERATHIFMTEENE